MLLRIELPFLVRVVAIGGILRRQHGDGRWPSSIDFVQPVVSTSDLRKEVEAHENLSHGLWLTSSFTSSHGQFRHDLTRVHRIQPRSQLSAPMDAMVFS